MFISRELHKARFYSAETASGVTHKREAHLPSGIYRDASDDSTSVLRHNLNWGNNYYLSTERSRLSAAVVDSRQEQH